MIAKVILNPYSNRWNAQRRWPEAEAALKAVGIDFSLDVSSGPHHAVQLAKDAALAGYSPIIVAGGDGTIGEVVNGIAAALGEEDLGVIGVMPLGTANDFAFNMRLPLSLIDAAKVIAAGKTVAIDVCKANDTYFINNSAMGLEPHVTVLQQKINFLKGIPRYLVAALQGIAQNPRWQATIKWDDGQYVGPLTLITVGNAPRTGGLFFMAPHADPSDGKLTAVLAYKESAFGLLVLLPKTMTPEGTFVHAKGVQEIHSTRISVSLESLSPAHCDGELFPEGINHVEYSIL
ncbi:MAG: diacylglycerol kinase family lipid kinase, partial [bacterium]|nr:diacylglycerol kinase family lipid kinase [bacterium]